MEVAEEVILLDKSFLSTTYDSMLAVPGYGFWQAEQDHERAYRELKIWLQVIQSQTHGAPWPALDIEDAAPSARRHVGAAGGVPRSEAGHDPPRRRAGAAELLQHVRIDDGGAIGGLYSRSNRARTGRGALPMACARLMAVRANLPADRFIDVQYRDTVTDPVGTGKRVLAAMGVPPTPADIAAMAGLCRRQCPRKAPGASLCGG